MNDIAEILASHDSWLGELVLQRRENPQGGDPIYEVVLDEMFLMSSLVNYSEIALADLGLAAIEGDEPLEVLVGGLGLGCTAVAALGDPRVRQVLVVECLLEVIHWHLDEVVPLAERLVYSDRCEFVHGDFFAMAAEPELGFDPEHPGRRFDAILLDIDHSPRALLHGSHQEFYEVDSLRVVARHLKPGGVFALWSADPPEPDFMAALGQVFAAHEAHEVAFDNPVIQIHDVNTVYVARVAR